MKIQIGASLAALALVLAGCGESGGGDLNAAAGNGAAPLTQIAAPDNGNWAEVVSETPEGGIRMGNPDAPIKLVEYASMTCPHCKTFSDDASEALRDTYVASGQVSWEFRHFLLSAPDAAMSVLARCQPLSAYFRTIEQLFSQQQELMSAIDEGEAQRIGALPPEQMVAPLARAMDLDTFFARRGMPEARFSACLADPQGMQRLSDGTSRAVNEEQVQGTPSFFINGQRQNVSDWRALEPLLRAAIGG